MLLALADRLDEQGRTVAPPENRHPLAIAEIDDGGAAEAQPAPVGADEGDMAHRDARDAVVDRERLNHARDPLDGGAGGRCRRRRGERIRRMRGRRTSGGQAQQGDG